MFTIQILFSLHSFQHFSLPTGTFSAKCGTGTRSSAVSRTQASAANSMYVSRVVPTTTISSGVNGEEERLTLIRYKRRKIEGKAVSTDSPPGLFSSDVLSRVMNQRPTVLYPGDKQEQWQVSADDLQRCHQAVREFKESNAWTTLISGATLTGQQCAATPPAATDRRQQFVKQTNFDVEVDVAAALYCLCVVKGLPPFVFTYLGHGEGDLNQLNLDQTCPERAVLEQRKRFAFVADKAEGGTLRDYMDSCLKDNRGADLESVFTQVCLALDAFQKYANFSHNDLHIDNVIIEPRRDHDAFSVFYDDRQYAFNAGSPAAKIIDFGQAAMVHPLRKVHVSSVFTGALVCDEHGADIAKLVVSMVKWAEDKARTHTTKQTWAAILGETLSQDVRAVLAHVSRFPVTDKIISGYVNQTDPNAEWFPINVGETPAWLLRHGACVRRFFVPIEQSPLRNSTSTDGTCAYERNIFFERPNDVWNSEAAIRRFRATNHAPLVELRMSAKAAFQAEQIMKELYHCMLPSLVNRGILKEFHPSSHLKTTSEQPAPMDVHNADPHLRRRIARLMLVKFQRGVMLYMRLFVVMDVPDELAVFANNLVALNKSIIEPRGASNNLSPDRCRINTQARLAAVCLIATNGGYNATFFNQMSIEILFFTNHAANVKTLGHMKKVAAQVYDKLSFGGEVDALRVPAQMLTHAEIYEGMTGVGNDDFNSYHFGNATNPLFYGRVVAS